MKYNNALLILMLPNAPPLKMVFCLCTDQILQGLKNGKQDWNLSILSLEKR